MKISLFTYRVVSFNKTNMYLWFFLTATVVIFNGICIGTIFHSMGTSHEGFTLQFILTYIAIYSYLHCNLFLLTLQFILTYIAIYSYLHCNLFLLTLQFILTYNAIYSYLHCNVFLLTLQFILTYNQWRIKVKLRLR